jgi:hypothetical protein
MIRVITKEGRLAARYIPAGYTEYRREGDSVVYVSPSGLTAIAYRGTAMNSHWHTTYRIKEQLDQDVDRFFKNIEETKKWHETRKATRDHGETDTQKVKKALKAAGYPVTSVHRDTGTASHWIDITIDDYQSIMNEYGDMESQYGKVLWIAQVASGREHLHDDIQTDLFMVNISVNFTKYHKCSECVISNCERWHKPEDCACGSFRNQEMVNIHYAIWSAPVLPPYINPDNYLFAEVPS